MTCTTREPIHALVVGGGMITHDQLLPSLYHLQRTGVVGPITICALSSGPLRALAEAKSLREAFPGQMFLAMPSLEEPPERSFPDLYREAIRKLPPRSLVVVAVPDHFHSPVIIEAIERHQHVLTVKPLVLQYAQAVEIEHKARREGLFVGVEYHKRFDRRALEARLQYRRGRFGEFRCGEAKLVEPYNYRHSNFQNWFTKANSDPFTYIGCHYVDLVYFITGLRPVEVAVRGVEGPFPNGNVGYLWSTAQVVWENGAAMSVLNGLGYPDQAAGSNDQGMCLFCEGGDCGAIIRHDDQFRGVSHGYVDREAGAMFRFINPDYLRLVPWEGEGRNARPTTATSGSHGQAPGSPDEACESTLRPAGYGHDSVEALVRAAIRVNAAGDGLAGKAALAEQQATLDEIDRHGILATPANSSINELVIEAGRLSIVNGGRRVAIEYGDAPHVRIQE
jgi:predicted dehydrogenase